MAITKKAIIRRVIEAVEMGEFMGRPYTIDVDKNGSVSVGSDGVDKPKRNAHNKKTRR